MSSAAPTLAFVLLITFSFSANAAPPCEEARNQRHQLSQARGQTGERWVSVAKAYLECKEAKKAPTPNDLNGIYVDVINSYREAVKKFEEEAAVLRDSQLADHGKRAKAEAKLQEVEAKLRETEANLREAEANLRETRAKLKETDKSPSNTKGEPLRQPHSAADRFAFRIESGYSAGRLTRSLSQTGPSHSGGMIQLSLLPRFSFPRAHIDFSILFGPYYSFWRARDKTIDTRLADARVHSFGGKFELGIGLGKRVGPYLSLHPSLELGLDFVRFDFNTSSPTDPSYLDARYIDMVGFVAAGNTNICAFYASVCLGARLRSVPGERSVPTTQITVSIDPVRLIFGINSEL